MIDGQRLQAAKAAHGPHTLSAACDAGRGLTIITDEVGDLVDGKGHCFQPYAAAPTNELKWWETPEPKETSRQRLRRRRMAASKILRGHSPKLGATKESQRGKWYPVTACATVPAQVGMTLEARASGQVDRIGIMRCGSVWTCPQCAQRIAVSRARDIANMIEAAREQGFRVEMVTFTQPHNLAMSAAECMTRLKDALRQFASGGSISRLLAKHGYLGQVKSIEVTRGNNSGWHFHAHAIFVFEPSVGETDNDTAEADLKRSIELKKELYPFWKNACAKVGARTPSFRHGLDVRAVWSSTDYIQKMPEPAKAKEDAGKKRWGAEAELSKSFLKEGRKSSRTPWELLDTADEDATDARLFAEYAAATWGRSQIEWSKGKRDLRKLFLGGAEEIADEALVYEETEWVFEDEESEVPDVGQANLVVERITIESSDAWRARHYAYGSIDRACIAIAKGEILNLVDGLAREGWIIEKRSDLRWEQVPRTDSRGMYVEDKGGNIEMDSILHPAEYVATFPPRSNG
ncbi:hypothetical protein [Qipengyuania gaetbuli]|uniref:hypothetical protein n=1 Tax=Qipengyuania gaetbuli TaxID=266952 RepID=UPI001CFE4C2C|nr:hypothetical protein [Qipengyuania gaetbuli]